MARGATATAGTVVRLPCGCPRQEVLDNKQHRKTCTKAKYSTGCDSLDCNGYCTVSGEHCDGEDGDDE